MSDHEQIVDSLRKEYCPPIDEGLFEALRLDYDDLTQPPTLTELRGTLDALKDHATSEEATGFDPSGTSGQLLAKNDASEPSPSCTERSSAVDNESITTGLSDFTWDKSVKDDFSALPSWDGLSEEQKIGRLAQLLPKTNHTTIRFKLRQNNSKFEQTMDDLLVLSFLDDDAKLHGDDLDLYAAGGSISRGRKRKSKKQERNPASVMSSAHTSSESLPTRNVWAAGKDDIQFITSRTTLSTETVHSLYHANGASLPATIAAISVKHAPSLSMIESLDASMQIHAADLGQDHPTIAQERIVGLLILSRNIPSAAQDLIKAMTIGLRTGPAEPARIIPKYSPVDLLVEDSTKESRAFRSSSSANKAHPETSQLIAAANRMAGHEAFAKASSAYRRGKSDRYMGGAAAYYAEVGRQNLRAAQFQSSAAADALVSMHETAKSIDLHGVSVMDAVRIASEKTEDWYESLGDTKYVKGGESTLKAGYRIVTGLGRHSKDGAPRIGPAVTKRLLNDGWKVEIGSGELLVTGKRRK